MLNQQSRKVVLVTGSAKRLGRATAEYLHDEGFNVLVHCHRSVVAGEELVANFNAKIPHSAALITADLTHIACFPKLIADALQHWGRLDALIHNASSFYPTPLDAVNETAWDDLLGTNLKAPYFLSLAAREALRVTQGAIVMVSDAHLERPWREYSVYCIAKSAGRMLTRSLAKEFAPDIRVNAVAPGIFLWPEKEAVTDDEKQQLLSEIPLARPGMPQELAKSIAFLLDTENFITGQVITIDGGRCLSW